MLRPTVDVQLSTTLPFGTIKTKALIDSGAPRCIFPRGVGDLLGVEFPKYESDAQISVKFMDRDWPGVTAEVDLVLQPFDDLGWHAEVDFVMAEGLPFALLGYEGFLNRWAVSFNGALGYMLIEQADEFDARLPDELFEELQTRWPGSYGR